MEKFFAKLGDCEIGFDPDKIYRSAFNYRLL